MTLCGLRSKIIENPPLLYDNILFLVNQSTENQRRIAKEHKEQEKRKQREMDDHLTSHWAEPVTSARSKPPAQSQVKPRSTVDDFEVKKETRTHREVPLSPPRHHSADAVPTARQDSSPSGLV